MVELKCFADGFKPRALFLAPIALDTEPVGDFSADMVDQPLKRLKSSTLGMDHGVDLGVGQIVEVITDVLLVGFGKSRLVVVDQQTQHDLAGTWRDDLRLGGVQPEPLLNQAFVDRVDVLGRL